MRQMTTRRALAATLALALAACEAQPIGTFNGAMITSEAAQAQTDLYFRPGEGSMLPGEADRVNRFLAALLLNSQDDVIITFGSTGSDVLDARRVAEARRAIASKPARTRIVRPLGFARAPDRPDVVLIQAVRYDRVKVTCPGSGRTAETPALLTPMPVMGCSNAVNIAVQADQKRDLTAPRRLQGADAIPAIRAVERYRVEPINVPPVGTFEN